MVEVYDVSLCAISWSGNVLSELRSSNVVVWMVHRDIWMKVISLLPFMP